MCPVGKGNLHSGGSPASPCHPPPRDLQQGEVMVQLIGPPASRRIFCPLAEIVLIVIFSNCPLHSHPTITTTETENKCSI